MMNRFAVGEQRLATLDTLERLRADSVDLSQPLAVDFHVAATSLGSAQSIAEAAAGEGFEVKVVDEGDGEYTVWCTTNLIATADSVATIEAKLDELALPLGGYIDGWGAEGGEA